MDNSVHADDVEPVVAAEEEAEEKAPAATSPPISGMEDCQGPDAELEQAVNPLDGAADAADAVPPKATQDVAPPPAKKAAEGFRCSYFDVSLVSRLQDDLLRGLARAALKKVEGNPFKSPKDVAPVVQAELLAFLQKHCDEAKSKGVLEPRGLKTLDTDEPESLPLQVVSEWLAAFSDAKRNVFGKVTAVFSDEDGARVAGIGQQLQHDNVWPTPQREELTLQLIRTLDPAGKDHCSYECSTAEELTSHKACCPIRPISCPFPGCPDTFKASYFIFHDTRCPFKPVPCLQECMELIPRREMDAHCSGPCSHRVVACPFQTAGCTQLVLQGGFAEHIQRCLSQHLQQVFTVVCDQGSRLQQLGQHMADVVTTVNTASRGTNQAINALRTEVLDEHKVVEKKMSSLQKEASDHKKEIQDMKKVVAELKKEMLELRKENALLKKAQTPHS